MIYLDSCIVIYWVEEKASEIKLLRQALANAQYHQCHALWTNDQRLIEISNSFAVNIIRQQA